MADGDANNLGETIMKRLIATLAATLALALMASTLNRLSGKVVAVFYSPRDYQRFDGTCHKAEQLF
jgi:hypothetical protein